MKKIAIFMAAVSVMATTFTSCKEDTQPRLEQPTEFVLNTPPMAENTYLLSEDNGIQLTVSQPNYGLGTVPNYTVLVSLDDKFAPETTRELEEKYTNARFEVPGESLSLALCDLLGYVSEDTYSDEPVSIFVKVKSTIDHCDYSVITSNAIELKSVVPYFAIKLPDNIWIIGECTGWDVTKSDMVLTETAVESRIYQGTYEIPAGEFKLRFYDQLGDWSSWSIGAQDPDEPVTVAFTDGVYEGPAFLGGEGDSNGKGAWNVEDWPGGTVKFTVNLSNPKKANVIFEVQ